MKKEIASTVNMIGFFAMTAGDYVIASILFHNYKGSNLFF
jgi:hypothetical protein